MSFWITFLDGHTPPLKLISYLLIGSGISLLKSNKKLALKCPFPLRDVAEI